MALGALVPGATSVSLLAGMPPAMAMPITAPACFTATDVRWSPDTVRAGSLFALSVPSTTRSAVSQITRARVAGERLHFEVMEDSTGGFRARALAAVPVDSARGITLQLSCADGTISTARIPTRPGDYELEALRVAPRFGARPDSAVSARQRRESARARAVSRESHNTPQLWNTPFAVPRATRITSGFGNGREFNGTVTSRHMGTDYAGAVGAPVRAANRGVVRIVDAFYLGGNVVYLDHGAGIVTAYLHLSAQNVAVGDTVAQGDVIGRVGATGRVTGPHLHVIARYGNITFDATSLWGAR